MYETKTRTKSKVTNRKAINWYMLIQLYQKSLKHQCSKHQLKIVTIKIVRGNQKTRTNSIRNPLKRYRLTKSKRMERYYANMIRDLPKRLF